MIYIAISLFINLAFLGIILALNITSPQVTYILGSMNGMLYCLISTHIDGAK